MKKENFHRLTIVLIYSLAGLLNTVGSSSQDLQRVKEQEHFKYVPVPQPSSTGELLVGAFRCPLWSEKTRPGCWEAIKKFPERTPLLGYYYEADPEFVDWEIKYAREHGISFFFECWFRKKGNAGQSQVKDTLGHWLHEGLFNSRYQEMIKFAILWENVNGIASSISSESDLIENLMPYWIENFFKKPNYLLIDGKPVFLIYGYQRFIDDLGGIEKAKTAISKMKKTCLKQGFNGLYLLAEHHTPFNTDISFLKEMGFDAITSYHWPSFSGLMPVVPESAEEIVYLQEKCWPKLEEISGLPSITTISAGWNSEPWKSSYYKGQWILSPDNFRMLCQKARQYSLEHQENPVSKIIMIDNWNEFGEGHYIFPTRQFGFGHLDAIRNAFVNNDTYHMDIVPSDIGLGPYIFDNTSK